MHSRCKWFEDKLCIPRKHYIHFIRPYLVCAQLRIWLLCLFVTLVDRNAEILHSMPCILKMSNNKIFKSSVDIEGSSNSDNFNKSVLFFCLLFCDRTATYHIYIYLYENCLRALTYVKRISMGDSNAKRGYLHWRTSSPRLSVTSS